MVVDSNVRPGRRIHTQVPHFKEEARPGGERPAAGDPGGRAAGQEEVDLHGGLQAVTAPRPAKCTDKGYNRLGKHFVVAK